MAVKAKANPIEIPGRCEAPGCLRSLQPGQGRVTRSGNLNLRTCFGPSCVAWARGGELTS